MRNSIEGQLSVADDVHIEDFGDELVALHLITEEIYVLNGSAAVFLRAIRSNGVAKKSLESAAATFGMEVADIEDDFAALISDLVARNLLVT